MKNLNWKIKAFGYRRKEALKLIFYLVFKETFNDIIEYFIVPPLIQICLKRAGREAKEKGCCGIGGTKWYERYLKMKDWERKIIFG